MENEKQYSYSLTEEEGYTSDIYDCIQEWKDNYSSGDYPFEMEVYKGENVTFKPSHFLPDLEDSVCDNVYDQCGDWANRWTEKILSMRKKLNKDFADFFDKWCEENDCKIDFHNVDNIKTETWIVRSDDDYEVIK